MGGAGGGDAFELGGGVPSPPPERPANAQPLSPMASVTDSNRPQPPRQPPPTACLTASEAASGVPSLLMHPWGGGGGKGETGGQGHCAKWPHATDTKVGYPVGLLHS